MIIVYKKIIARYELNYNFSLHSALYHICDNTMATKMVLSVAQTLFTTLQ